MSNENVKQNDSEAPFTGDPGSCVVFMDKVEGFFPSNDESPQLNTFEKKSSRRNKKKGKENLKDRKPIDVFLPENEDTIPTSVKLGKMKVRKNSKLTIKDSKKDVTKDGDSVDYDSDDDGRFRYGRTKSSADITAKILDSHSSDKPDKEMSLSTGEEYDDRRSTSEIYLRKKKRGRSKNSPSLSHRRKSVPALVQNGKRRKSKGGQKRRSRHALKFLMGKEALSILQPLQRTGMMHLTRQRHGLVQYKSANRNDEERHKTSKGYTTVLAEYCFDHDSRFYFISGRRMAAVGDNGSAYSSFSEDFDIGYQEEYEENEDTESARIAIIMRFWISHPRKASTRIRETFGFLPLNTKPPPQIICPKSAKSKLKNNRLRIKSSKFISR